jgi:hypothetical protein
VGDHQEARESCLSRAFCRIFNQCAADAMSHCMGFDEEVVELGILPGRPPGGEPEEPAAAIGGDADAARGQGGGINAEDVGVCIEVRRVLRPDVGRTAVDLLERVSLVLAGRADAGQRRTLRQVVGQLTGSFFSWLRKAPTTGSGLPASLISGKRFSVSSKRIRSSSRARAAPRQK